jgi:hypothetical protein
MNQPARDYRVESILMFDPCPVILEDWSTETHDGRLFLNGVVYGHPRMADGKYIRTAHVTWWLHEVGIVQTATVSYILCNRR